MISRHSLVREESTIYARARRDVDHDDYDKVGWTSESSSGCCRQNHIILYCSQ